MEVFSLVHEVVLGIATASYTTYTLTPSMEFLSLHEKLPWLTIIDRAGFDWACNL